MKQTEVIIIGGGPCGLAAAIAFGQIGKEAIVIEKGNIVNAIYHYPTHQTFFSSSEKLEIGDVAFITQEYKPRRNQALTYYREVVKRKALKVHTFEKVLQVNRQDNGCFFVKTTKQTYQADYVVVATGYYDHPNYMNIPGENLAKVSHYFKEAHPYFDTDVAVIGGKNSSVDAAIELAKAGARVTVLYRGDHYSKSIKPWILPEFESLVRHEKVKMEFNSIITHISETDLTYQKEGKQYTIENDFVFAMTGYHPDHPFLQQMGVHIDPVSGRPNYHPETMETNVEGIFIAGVLAAGNDANEIFIENGRFHGEQIANAVAKREKKNVLN
ncbi:YpdA family putative bacillithiol disulfide reductase [Bacillaceae bacterium Marseille-Q3522]|nr:YpdA family putative bacillithiol disulfide reductase [Bacillaceae bacterium Marseille-Q3522]